jgi:hypothetical protein
MILKSSVYITGSMGLKPLLPDPVNTGIRMKLLYTIKKIKNRIS